MKIIDDAVASGQITAEMAMLWKQVVEMYPDAPFDAQKVLDTFEEIKQNTIDPYFDSLIDLAQTAVQNSLDYLKARRAEQEASELAQKGFVEEARTKQVEAEQIRKEQSIRNQKADLEARGMTFSGENVRLLGTQGIGAYGGGGNLLAPAGIEGLVPTEHRMIASSSQASYEQTLAELQSGANVTSLDFQHNLDILGSQAEQQLGSGFVSGIGIPGFTPVGGVQGTLPFQQEQAWGQALGQIAGLGGLQQNSFTDLYNF